jgi:hypothetical protein
MKNGKNKKWRATWLFVLISLSYCQAQTSLIKWIKIDEGLETAEYLLPSKSSHGDSKVTVLKVDPTKYGFKLLSAEQLKTNNKKAPQWAKDHKAIAVFNTGMFKLEGNFKTSTGFMKSFGYTNNSSLNPSYKNIFAFNAIEGKNPPAQIIDMTCQNWPSLKKEYNSFTQCIRMIGCDGKPTWQPSNKKWSMVTIAQNKTKEILILFVRSPYKVHEYIQLILDSPFEITRMMYLEGGPEASLYLDYNGFKIEKMGSYETGFNLNDNNKEFWDIPNVIGIQKK